jgi:mRNA interferase RelE/StbE
MWAINFSEKAAEELLKCPRNIQKTIVKAIRGRLSENPYGHKALSGNLKGYYRLRVANYRVVYSVREKELAVLIITIDVRSKVYKFLK